MSLEEFQVEPIHNWLGASIWNYPSREQGDDERGRRDPHGQSLVEELPRDWDAFGPTNVGDKEVGKLRRRQLLSGGGEAGGDLDRPGERVGSSLLLHFRELEDDVPETARDLHYRDTQSCREAPYMEEGGERERESGRSC